MSGETSTRSMATLWSAEMSPAERTSLKTETYTMLSVPMPRLPQLRHSTVPLALGSERLPIVQLPVPIATQRVRRVPKTTDMGGWATQYKVLWERLALLPEQAQPPMLFCIVAQRQTPGRKSTSRIPIHIHLLLARRAQANRRRRQATSTQTYSKL